MLRLHRKPQVVERRSYARFMAHLPAQNQSLLMQRPRRRVIAQFVRDDPKIVKRISNATLITHLAPQRQTLFIQRSRRRVVALTIGHNPQIVQRLRGVCLVTRFTYQRQAAIQNLARLRILSLTIKDPAHFDQHLALAGAVLRCGAPRLRQPVQRRVIIAAQAAQLAQRKLRARCRRGLRRLLRHL